MYNISIMKKLIVNKKYNEKKLINFLLGEFPNLKSSAVYKALRKKDIIVNDKRINDNIIVYTGDVVTVYITDEQLYGNFSLCIVGGIFYFQIDFFIYLCAQFAENFLRNDCGAEYCFNSSFANKYSVLSFVLFSSIYYVSDFVRNKT